ncbi:5-formyltetrahydrofolate cyclo-ligase [Viscerimonas tarda]
MEKKPTKDALRQEIAALKKNYPLACLQEKSEEVFSVLEITGIFQSATTLFIYNSLKDEVSTPAFIARWCNEKNFFLPVVSGSNLIFRAYNANENYETSALGVKEPAGTDFTDYNKIDLVIVPGLAFDRKMNRLGRGKGYYDRFLAKIKAPKIGVCFDFQLLDTIPSDNHDIKMDMIVSENELIW